MEVSLYVSMHACMHNSPAGVTMFRHLPRHMFGLIQSKLFPKYFLLGTILSSITALSYLVVHPFSDWRYQEKVQVGGTPPPPPLQSLLSYPNVGTEAFFLLSLMNLEPSLNCRSWTEGSSVLRCLIESKTSCLVEDQE